jgi:hypothetical protein
MKQRLQLRWKQIQPKPDPIHGVPLARSSHGVSILTKRNTLLIYGGEHVARTPIGMENSCWACYLGSSGSSSNRQRMVETAAASSVSTTSTPLAEEPPPLTPDMEEPFWKWIGSTNSTSSSNHGNTTTNDDTRTVEVVVPPARIGHAQAVYEDRYVYVFGGRAGMAMEEQAMNDLWVLDTEDNYRWIPVLINTLESDPIPEPRSYHRMICIGAALYVFGGCSAQHGRLNDLYKFDIVRKTWHNLGRSFVLSGRGGTNMLPLNSGDKIAIVAGFDGEETSDGHMYDTKSRLWEPQALTSKLDGLRPRSVCASASFPKNNLALIFGGEVDPSDRGHEGAGGFENDVVVLDEKMGFHVTTIDSPKKREQEAITNRQQWSDSYVFEDANTKKYKQPWPQERGWSDAAAWEDEDKVGHFYMFGGLTGDDTNPTRLDDLWKLEVQTI